MYTVTCDGGCGHIGQLPTPTAIAPWGWTAVSMSTQAVTGTTPTPVSLTLCNHCIAALVGPYPIPSQPGKAYAGHGALTASAAGRWRRASFPGPGVLTAEAEEGP